MKQGPIATVTTLLLNCVLVISAVAQTAGTTGLIQGTISDSSGSGIPSAKVSARNADTSMLRVSQTDDAGGFVIPTVGIGFWRLAVEAPGFSPAETEPFQVSVGQVVIHRLQLQPAGVMEKLEVREHPSAIETQASTASVALGYERIEEAPARSRSYLNFVLAAPAVAPSAGSASQRTMTGVRSPLPDTGFTFAGMRPRNNSIQIDGVDNRDETTGGNRVAVGLEMVQEFRVSAISIGAELGGAAGGVLNMVTRSGANLWHGDATWFMQNEALNAKRPEVDDAMRPRFRRYQPGVSAMGPLQRDQTFIAAAVEYETEAADEFGNVPEDALEAFSASPLSGRFSVTGELYPTWSRGSESSVRADHHAGAADAFWSRYAFSRGRVLHEVQGALNFADRSAQGSSLTTDHSLVGSWMRVLGPSAVNDVRVQIGQRSMELQPNVRSPMFEVPGFITVGQFFGMDADRIERHYQVVENLQFAFRRHRLSTGADAHRVTLNSALRNRYSGVYVFPTLEDLRNGRPDMFIQTFGDPVTTMTTTPLGVWLQDRWGVRAGLTVELGVRYDHQIMPSGLPGSSHNLAPRLGLAWQPSMSKPLVIRAGAGLFYDRYPLAYLNDALQKDGIQGFEQYAVGSAAAAIFNASRGELLDSPVRGIPGSTYTASRDFPSTYSRKLSVGVEYGLDSHTTVSLEAASVSGFHLSRVLNARGIVPAEYLLEQTAKSAYTGATITVNRRLRNELAWLVSYSYEGARDDASDFDEHPSNPLETQRDWGPSRQDQRQRISASALFELPADDLAWVPEALQRWLHRLSIAPIFTAGSGRPINALLTTDRYRTGAYPISARPEGFARNPFRSSAVANLDIRVMKTIPMLRERAVLQFGVESFNALNHKNPERVSQFYAAGETRLGTYGQTIESLPARQVQLMMQFEF